MNRVVRKIGQTVRRHKLIVISVGVLVLLSGFYLLSHQLWKDYQTAYEASHRQFQEQVDRVFAMSTASSDEKRAKLIALKEITQQPRANCQPSLVIAWQRILPPLQEQEKHCEDMAAKDEALKDSLSKVVVYLENEQALLEAMTSTQLSAEVDEATLEAQVTQWQDLLTRVKELAIQSDFEPVKQVAIEATEAIAAAWRVLQEANKATDQTAYEDARTKLTESYDKLAAVAPTSEKQLTALIEAVRSAYAISFQ